MSNPRILVFASRNPDKLKEVSAILGKGFRVAGLDSLGFQGDIPEPFDTLEENALAKARFVYSRYQCDCFADDTGLEVEALKGLPGVKSARYAGKDQDSAANIRKLLGEMDGKDNREARFRTVIALIIRGREHLFEGVVSGNIATGEKGGGGFGYDPVFIPDGYNRSFAEMDTETKNLISHRKDALEKLAHFLGEQ